MMKFIACILLACAFSANAATELWPGVQTYNGTLLKKSQIIVAPTAYPNTNGIGGFSVKANSYYYTDTNALATMTNLQVGNYSATATSSEGDVTTVYFQITNAVGTYYIASNYTVPFFSAGALNAYSTDQANALFVPYGYFVPGAHITFVTNGGVVSIVGAGGSGGSDSFSPNQFGTDLSGNVVLVPSAPLTNFNGQASGTNNGNFAFNNTNSTTSKIDFYTSAGIGSSTKGEFAYDIGPDEFRWQVDSGSAMFYTQSGTLTALNFSGGGSLLTGLASSQLTGTVATNNLPANLAALTVNNAVQLTNLLSTSLNVPSSSGGFVASFYAKDNITTIYTNGLASGQDNTWLFLTENSQGSGASIGWPRTGTNALDPLTGAAPQFILSINANGSTNYIYDLLAAQMMNVPANAPAGDLPGYNLWVQNPSQPACIASAGNGGNMPYVIFEPLTHMKLRFPLAQGYNSGKLVPANAGYIDAAVLDNQAGTFMLWSNLFVGGKAIYLGTNSAGGVIQITDAAGLRGDAFNQAVNLTLGNATIQATNFSALGNASGTLGYTFVDGSGMITKNNGNILLETSGNTLVATILSTAIRFENNSDVLIWGPGGATDTGIGRASSGVVQIQDGSGNDRDLKLRTATLSGTETNKGLGVLGNSVFNGPVTNLAGLTNTTADIGNAGTLHQTGNATLSGSNTFFGANFTANTTHTTSTNTSTLSTGGNMVVSGTGLIGGNLAANSGVTTKITSKSASYTLTTSDYVVVFTGSTAAQTLTLPTAVGITGQTFCVKNSSSVTVTLATTSSQTIFTASAVTTASLAVGDCYVVISDGSNWHAGF